MIGQVLRGLHDSYCNAAAGAAPRVGSQRANIASSPPECRPMRQRLLTTALSCLLISSVAGCKRDEAPAPAAPAATAATAPASYASERLAQYVRVPLTAAPSALDLKSTHL